MEEAAIPVFLEVEEVVFHMVNEAKSAFVIQVASDDTTGAWQPIGTIPHDGSISIACAFHPASRPYLDHLRSQRRILSGTRPRSPRTIAAHGRPGRS